MTDYTLEPRRPRRQLEASLPATPLHVDGDPLRLEQIFVNLLGNASKFTREGGRIWLSAAAELTPRGAPPRVAVRVRDNGVGIEPALMPRIFDLFAQGERLSARSRSGIGLGLALARRLVELHGGTIEAHSAGNALGSEFVVRLPLVSAPPVPVAEAVEPEAKRASGPARRVLVVDDNRDSATSLQYLLTTSGHEVRVARDGAAAIAEAIAFRAEVVVLDIGLPDMDGYEVASALRGNARTRDALIVAVTGHARDADRERSAEAGIDAHMTKPVDLDALMERIATGTRRP